MAANTSRIVVDAGGRIFHTTRDTLLMSGAGYFTALFGPTGVALRSLGDADDGADASASEKADGPSTKRSRTDPTEIFIDRNPELFSIVLDFMRSGKLPSKVKRDLDCLDDLTTEAEFFIFDELKEACSEAKTELKKALSDIAGTEPKAKFDSIILGAQGSESAVRVITVPRGKVLYLVSAVLGGKLQVMRYTKGKNQKKDDIRGCYIECDNSDSGDFQLFVGVDRKWVCIAHCGINHIHEQGNSSLDVDFRQPLGMCLSGGENGTVYLQAKGHADWHILYWVGDAEAIPGLKSPDDVIVRGGRKVIHHHSANADEGVSDALTAMLAMQVMRTSNRARR